MSDVWFLAVLSAAAVAGIGIVVALISIRRAEWQIERDMRRYLRERAKRAPPRIVS